VLLVRELRKDLGPIDVVEVGDPPGLERALGQRSFDLVITDYKLGWTDGLVILRAAKARWPDAPVIMYTGPGTEEVAVEAMKAGLDDYILKSPQHLFRLALAVRSALDRARRRRESRVAQARFQALIEHSADAIALFAADGAILYGSPSTTRILGYPLDEFVGHNAFEFIHPADRPLTEERLGQAMARPGEDIAVQARVRHKDGRWRVLQGVFTNLLHDPAVGAIVNNYRDWTERTDAEHALRRSEAHLARAQHIAHLGSWELNLTNLDNVDQNPLWWSDEVYRIFGHEPGAFPASNEAFFRAVHPDDAPRVEEAMRQALADGTPYSVEHRIVLPGGDERIVAEHGLVERDADGRPARMLGTVLDVTPRRQLEDQLRQAQKMEAVGRLAGGVAHDFNNIITAIIGNAELLLQDIATGDARRLDVEEIKKSAERAAGLTRQLLAFSRKQLLQPTALDLNSVVQSMDKLLRRVIGEDIALAAVLAPDLWVVRADPGQLEQVIMNLAVNARDAMPRGGSLTVETQNALHDQAYAAAHTPSLPGEYVMLAVSDTGVGMDAEVKGHLFEPFFTTKPRDKGTGLGLATVYGIVKQSDGFIWVYSEPGKGTTFKIYLPRYHGPKTAATRHPSPPAGGALGTETVLLVEDEAAVRSLARRVLERHGYRVIEAPNADDALARCREHASEIHLLLTDVVMPGLGGRELAIRVAELRPDVKILYMSGYTDDAVVRHGVLEAEMAYLAKPFTPEGLASKVREVLNT